MQRTTLFMAPLVITALLLPGCAGSAADTPLEVTEPSIDVDEVLSAVEMSVPWLESLALQPGQIVLVPSDESVLALDADALATLATDGLEGAVIEPGAQWPPEMEDGEATLRTVDGRQLSVRSDDTGIYVHEVGVQEAVEWNGYTLVLMDGVLTE